MDNKEFKLKALEMVFETQNDLSVTQKMAIKICLGKIDFMFTYNPISTTPTKQKKEFHSFWENVEIELNSMLNQCE